MILRTTERPSLSRSGRTWQRASSGSRVIRAGHQGYDGICAQTFYFYSILAFK
jgi:hypothetical protein